MTTHVIIRYTRIILLSFHGWIGEVACSLQYILKFIQNQAISSLSLPLPHTDTHIHLSNCSGHPLIEIHCNGCWECVICLCIEMCVCIPEQTDSRRENHRHFRFQIIADACMWMWTDSHLCKQHFRYSVSFNVILFVSSREWRTMTSWKRCLFSCFPFLPGEGSSGCISLDVLFSFSLVTGLPMKDVLIRMHKLKCDFFHKSWWIFIFTFTSKRYNVIGTHSIPGRRCGTKHIRFILEDFLEWLFFLEFHFLFFLLHFSFFLLTYRYHRRHLKF